MRQVRAALVITHPLYGAARSSEAANSTRDITAGIRKQIWVFFLKQSPASCCWVIHDRSIYWCSHLTATRSTPEFSKQRNHALQYIYYFSPARFPSPCSITATLNALSKASLAGHLHARHHQLTSSL